MDKNEYFMNIALEEAKKAYASGEIPVGAVIVKENKIISMAHNKKDSLKKVTKHAEILAIEEANEILKDWRLNNCVIYVTMEPCPMCASAIQQSRIKKVVYGCVSNQATNTKIINEIFQNIEFNHKVVVEKGILENECSKIIKDFFKEIR